MNSMFIRQSLERAADMYSKIGDFSVVVLSDRKALCEFKSMIDHHFLQRPGHNSQNKWWKEREILIEYSENESLLWNVCFQEILNFPSILSFVLKVFESMLTKLYSFLGRILIFCVFSSRSVWRPCGMRVLINYNGSIAMEENSSPLALSECPIFELIAITQSKMLYA